jgi:lysophospholipase L1-like esterase
LSDQKSPVRTRVLVRLFFWFLLPVLLLLPFVAAEIYLRSIGVGDPVLYYGNTSYRFAPWPNQKHVGLNGAMTTIDSKGFRGVKEWTAPAYGKILFIGSSITWGGPSIDDKDLYTNIVCVRLEKSLHRDFTCGNAAVNSYGTENMAERIRYGDADESVIVVTIGTFHPTRGLTDLDSTPYLTVPPPAAFKALWETIAFAAWHLLHRLRPIYYQDKENNLRVAERRLHNLFDALRETDRPGRKVLMVFMPSKEEIKGNKTDLTRQVRTVLKNSQLDFLDLLEVIAAAPSVDDLFLADGTHLNRAGHAFVGQQIAQKVERVFAKQP